jgi:hypothetical protein
MKRALICLTTLALATIALPTTAQVVPELINYQGLLSDASGTPLDSGSCDLVFSLYASPEATIPIWGPEVHEEAQVVQGRFNVILGSTVSLEEAFSASDRWLGVAVSPEAEIMPRQRVLSAPYAMAAHNGNPVGGIIMWWGDVTDIPHGWQLCDGSPISEGPLAGMSTPDLSDRFVRGAPSGDSSRGQLDLSGADSVTLTTANLPNHVHGIQDAFMLEDLDWVGDRFGGSPPAYNTSEFGYEATNGEINYWGDHDPNTNNNAFVYRNDQTVGTTGATAQPLSTVPRHAEMFFIIRIL